MQHENNSCSDIESLRKVFQDRGVLRLENLLPADKIASACKAARDRMALAGIWKDGTWQVEHLRNAPLNEGAKYGRQLKGCPEFDDLVKDEIPQVVADLLDRQNTFTGMDVPQPLFTLPNADSWVLPHMAWHLDAPRLPDWDVPGVQIFTFLETVAPTGGGTLVVSGSHRLLNGSERISSKEVKRRLKTEPYFHDLMSESTTNRQRLLHESGSCKDIELRVVELSGEPGDVYFIDLRVLHAGAPNATSTPRMMLTRRFFLEAIREMI